MPLRRPSSNADTFDKKKAAEAEAPEDEEGMYEPEDEDEETDTPTSLQDYAGWDAAKRVLEQAGAAEGVFNYTNDQQLIKFLSDAPVSSYIQHWVERDGERRPYTCLKTGCPLCAVGVKTRGRFGFSVVVIADDVSAPVILWAGPKLFEDIEAAHNARTGPLTKHFYAVHKTGEKLKTKYYMQLVRGRDLPEEWNLDTEEVEAACAKAKPHAPSDVLPEKSTKAELQEIARSLP